MNPNWKTFLEQQSTITGNADQVAAETATIASDCALMELSGFSLIAIRGEDRDSFLQGQLTNDIRELSDTHTQLSGRCSPKGRMLANFRVLRRDNCILLQLPGEKLEEILKRLRMFVLRSKVEITDASDELIRIGIAGDCAAELLAATFAELPERDNDMTRTGELNAIRMAGSTPRFEVIGPLQPIMALWQTLSTTARIVNSGLWALLDIRAGIPTVYAATTDAFVPQMANMQLIDGVSFTKGCYTGQEVVARMKYLGKLKRRMYLTQVDSDIVPRPGDELHSDASKSSQASGRIVDAKPVGNGRYEMLAVIEIEAAENGQVRLGANGPILSVEAPPYGFDEETALR